MFIGTFSVMITMIDCYENNGDDNDDNDKDDEDEDDNEDGDDDGKLNCMENCIIFHGCSIWRIYKYLKLYKGYTVYPKKYAHGFVVLCFVVVMQSFIMNSHEVFIHIHQVCFAGTGAIVRLPQCQ